MPPLLEAQLPAADKDAIAKYLAGLFPLGGKQRDLKLDALVRDENALDEAIYVQYELPPIQGGDFSNAKIAPGFHDAFPGQHPDYKGKVWLSGTGSGSILLVDVRTPGLTADERTKQWRITTPNNFNVRPHGITEFRGIVWTSNLSDGGGVTEFNPKTGDFHHYLPEESKGSGGFTVVADSKGNIWWTNNMGHGRVVRLDAVTKKITEYNPVPAAGWYGITVDKRDRVFPAGYGLGYDVPMYDPKTDKWTLYKFPNTNRRPTVDSKGVVWTSQFYGNSFGRLAPDSNKTSDFKLPLRYGNPYEISADSQDNLWATVWDYDSLVKFDPKTKKFTYFPFPILNGEVPKINRDAAGDPWFALGGQLTTFRPNGNRALGGNRARSTSAK
jgi:streptogramin lyase